MIQRWRSSQSFKSLVNFNIVKPLTIIQQLLKSYSSINKWPKTQWWPAITKLSPIKSYSSIHIMCSQWFYSMLLTNLLKIYFQFTYQFNHYQLLFSFHWIRDYLDCFDCPVKSNNWWNSNSDFHVLYPHCIVPLGVKTAARVNESLSDCIHYTQILI